MSSASATAPRVQEVPAPSTAPLRLVIAGGGTGGHVLPVVAVLEELRHRGIPFEALWIGSNDGVERDAAERADVAYRAIATGKLRRYADARTLRDAGRIPIGVAQAWRAVRSFRPDVILSTGGFVSVPTVIGGSRMAPVLTHEQTAILGLATRINLRFGPTLAVSFRQTMDLARGLTKNVVFTGNPVRRSLFDGDAERGRRHFGFTDDLPIVMVMGGARGASPINQRIEALLPEILDHCQVVHQTGPASANDDAARLTALRETWTPAIRRRYVVSEFLRDELADLYAATSLVVARAGAGTVAELSALGVPSILIPLPHAGGDEQTRNAEALSSEGACVVLREADATPDALQDAIVTLVNDRDRLRSMADAARAAGNPNAAAALVDVLIDLAARRE